MDRYAPAPFFASEAAAPEGAHAVWATAADGVRLRLGHLGRGAAGTVICFPGRTEYIEKYGPTAVDFAAAGWGLVAIDWRGQGLADKLIADTRLGHVGDFADYQLDVAALTAFAEDQNLPRPWVLLAHSMGGAIGVRALWAGLDVTAAAFTAPMWNLTLTPPLPLLARSIPRRAVRLGLGHRVVPGSGQRAYILSADPNDNALTTDPETYRWFRGHVQAHPELALSGPTLQWLAGAMAEFDAFAAGPAPAVPCRVWLGSRERIVSPQAIRARARAWDTLDLVEVAGAEHEVLMERPEIRNPAVEQMLTFYRDNSAR